MAASENSIFPAVAATARSKREDYKRTKYDTDFSKWQVLIGPCDWEDHSQGKEGAARYRVHNLPTRSGPGLYELGIAVSRSGLGCEVGKIDPDDIVVVYLGQADNLRSRLQHYGRSGAHLGNSYAGGNWNDSKIESPQKGPGLFEEISSRGHSIVFRWASMKDKKNAERTEAKLLDTFDYAWNKGSNGARRPNDILQKLGKIGSSTNRFSNISKRLGIKNESTKPPSPEKCKIPVDEDNNSFLPGIFKFSRSQPRLVSDKFGIDEDFIKTCGFIMGDAVPCRRPPVPGRKRCEEHKGMRIYVCNSKSIAEGNSHYAPDGHLASSSHNDQDLNTTCGVNLGDGNFCRRQAVTGRKRCEEHKGMRINSCVSKPTAEGKSHISAISSVFTSSGYCTNNNASTFICGANLGNGISICRRQPTAGNKRCWQHKGQRADSAFSGSSSNSCVSKPTAEEKCHISGISSVFTSSGYWTNNNASTFICGATLRNGSVCSRQPTAGNKRCWQHKGQRADSAFW